MTDVGVVMPVYFQNPRFLQLAVQSMLAQTYTGFRLIIVIDGAPSMERLVREYAGNDPRVTLVSYPRNRGVAHALNTGFGLLDADPAIHYLTWVSSDNVYLPDFLGTLRLALAAGPESLGVAYSSFYSIDNAGKPIYDEEQLAEQRKGQAAPKEKLLDSSIIGVSFMYKSCYAKKIAGYGMEPVEDYDYWLRLTEHCDIQFLPVELVNYRVNSTHSISAKLTSTDNHRLWRYKYHLARHLARRRRHIQPEITILYPVHGAEGKALDRLENLYEQTYSNYLCQVLDLSLSQEPTVRFGEVQHPLTGFVAMPGSTVLHAVRKQVEKVTTPYTIILGPQPFVGQMDLAFLLEELVAREERVASVYYRQDHSAIDHRSLVRDGGAGKDNLYNELFHSVELKRLMRRISADGTGSA